MPTLPYIVPFDGFEEVATTGKRNDDTHRFEMTKESFNNVHHYVRKSMDLNFEFLDMVVIKSLNHAVYQFEKRQDEFDIKPVIQKLRYDILSGFHWFITSYHHAEFMVTRSISSFKKAVYPTQAKSYKHYINDGDKDKMNEMIVTHLYRQGLFDVGDELISEANFSGLVMDMMSDARSKFVDMHAILDGARKCEIDLPLQWISDNRGRLGEVKAADLQFMVHVIKYTQMVEDANMMEDESARNKAILEALNYAKTNVTCYTGKNFVHEKEKLIACILYKSNQVKLIGHSRYYHFFDGTYKRNLVEEMEKQFCILMGQCGTNPLPTLMSVGEVVVSGVCKAANIVKKDVGLEWGNLCQIPLKLSLLDKFKFHSQFACPLSKEFMKNGLNPPIALSCGHVFSLQQVIFLMRLMPLVKTLKCPYCKAFALQEHCKTVYF